MMQPLISSEEVLSLAFSRQEYLPYDLPSPQQILSAQERYIRPVVGEALYKALGEGAYPELLANFVAPVIAYGVRSLLLGQLRLKIATGGLMEPSGEGWKAISAESLRAAQQALRSQFEPLRSRLDRELKYLSEQGLLPEYEPTLNVRERCRIYGGFVQNR